MSYWFAAEPQQLEKDILNKSYDMVMIFDPGTLRFLYVNQMMCKQSGYVQEELLQLKLSDLHGEFALDQWRENLHLLCAGTISFINQTTYFIQKNQNPVSVEVYLECMNSGFGTSIVGLARNISDQQQVIEKIQILSRAASQSASTILITDQQGKIEYVNPSFEKLTGYTAREVIGQTPRILKSGMQPDYVYKELWETITAGDEWRGEFHNKRKDGELFWESACISAIRDRQGRITHFLAVKEDITQKVAAQQAVVRAHVTLNEIFNVAGDGLAVMDIDFNIIKVNEAFLRIFEVTRQEVIGCKCYNTVRCPNCCAQNCNITQVLQSKKRIEFDMTRTRNNGKRCSLITSVTLFHDVDGQTKGFVANIKDITERHDVTQRLRKDFMLAGKIQNGFLPDEIENELFQLKNVYKPVHHVSGDFLEYKWDEHRKVLFGCIVDVMGHGMAAALQTSALRVLVRQIADYSCSLSRKMANINEQSAPYFAEDSFAAAICFELNFKTGRLTYCSGGINYFIHVINGKQQTVKVPGSLVGVMPDSIYDEHCIEIKAGESFVFLSDGLFDILPGNLLENKTFPAAYVGLQELADISRDDASAICVEIRNPY